MVPFSIPLPHYPPSSFSLSSSSCPPHAHPHPPLLSQERSSENLPRLPPNIACLFVRLVECLMGSPPRIDCLKYVCDHLLVSDLNDVKYVAAASAMETSVSVFEGEVLGECIRDYHSSAIVFFFSFSRPSLPLPCSPSLCSPSLSTLLSLLSLFPIPPFLPSLCYLFFHRLSIPSDHLPPSPLSFLPSLPLHLFFPLFASISVFPSCLPSLVMIYLFHLGQRASTPHSHAQPLASAGSASDVSQPFSPGGSIAHTVMVLSNSVDGETEEVITFDVQPGEGRLPDSSYTEEDSLFTWTDITGMHHAYFLPIHSPTHSPTLSLTHPPTHSLTHPSPTLSLTHPLTHPPTHSLTHPSPTLSLTHPPTHSLTHSLTHSPTHSLTHPPTHSPTHPPLHSLTHPSSQSLAYTCICSRTHRSAGHYGQ